jgi:hypothetical protein
MAYLVRRSPARVEIRESRATPKGPRSFVLASFSGPLTPQILERAAARARRPFDARMLSRRARTAGVPIAASTHEPEARSLLARLRRSDPLEPGLASALRRELSRLPGGPVPETLAEVSEWLGTGPAQRGAALRDLLDLYGRIATSRMPRRQRERPRFPHFSSRRAG